MLLTFLVLCVLVCCVFVLFVFSLCLVCLVQNIACVSGLSILDCSSDFL